MVQGILWTAGRREEAERRFRVPGGVLVPLTAVILALWLLSGLGASQAAVGAAALVVGLLLYLGLGRVRYNRSP